MNLLVLTGLIYQSASDIIYDMQRLCCMDIFQAFLPQRNSKDYTKLTTDLYDLTD